MNVRNTVERLPSNSSPCAAPRTRLKIVAVLGRRDEPTDGVEDYCRFLGQAFEEAGHEFSVARIAWREKGWLNAAREVAQQSEEWRGKTALLQFTSLSWSRRGFPFGALAIARAMKRAGARLAVVYHEPDGTWRKGAISKLRARAQRIVIQRLYHSADCAFFTVPIADVSWLSGPNEKFVFIPIGANVPVMSALAIRTPRRERNAVGVFCMTEGGPGRREAHDIATAIREAARTIPALHLRVFGRGAEEAGATLQYELAKCGVKISVSGVLPAKDVVQIISEVDALLFVRGSVSLRRGSALAAVACGVPLIAYGAEERSSPLNEAGVITVPLGDAVALGRSLAQVLKNEELWESLRMRSLKAYEEIFSWRSIARRFEERLAQ